MKTWFALVFLAAAPGAVQLEFDSVYVGEYTRGHEVHVFQPCKASKVYWVSGAPNVIEPLADYYESNTSEPYQPIFLRFRGHPHIEEGNGFSEDYDGLLHVSEVLYRSVEIPTECSEQDAT